MNFRDHDRDLLVWGVATQTDTGELTVRARQSEDAAQADAAQAPKLTVTGHHPVTGKQHTIPDVWPVVYCHAEDGWTLSANGWPLSAHIPAAVNQQPQPETDLPGPA